MKTKTKKKQQPHRYFLSGLNPEWSPIRIIVFEHGQEPGRAYFEESVAENAWWSFEEMDGMIKKGRVVEIPAKLLKKVARI